MNLKSKRFSFGLLTTILMVGIDTGIWIKEGFSEKGTQVVLAADNITQVTPAADSGFQQSYYLYVPSTVENKGTDDEQVYLLVLPLNTGPPNNDMSVFDKGAFNKIRQCQDIADDLEVAFLVPVFPRPAKYGLVFTHTHLTEIVS